MSKCIIFDLDGTLVTLPIRYELIQKKLRELFALEVNFSPFKNRYKIRQTTEGPLFPRKALLTIEEAGNQRDGNQRCREKDEGAEAEGPVEVFPNADADGDGEQSHGAEDGKALGSELLRNDVGYQSKGADEDQDVEPPG